MRAHRLLLLFVLIFSITACSKKTDNTSTPTPPINPVNPTPSFDPNAIRAVWITTTASTALNSLDNIKQTVANCKAAGINNLFVVVFKQYKYFFL